MAKNFQTYFSPHFFLLQLNTTYMKRILHLKNITLKSSYNWFKIDILKCHEKFPDFFPINSGPSDVFTL